MTIQQRAVPPAQVASPCPYCQARALRWYRSQVGDKCQVVCEGCGAAGPFDSSPDDALRRWLEAAVIVVNDRDEPVLNTELGALAAPALEKVLQEVTRRVLARLEAQRDPGVILERIERHIK
jgi:hypothetical protein